MNIAYSSSDKYSMLAGISIISLFENNKDVDEINVYIIDNNISIDNKQNINLIAKKYNRKIEFVEIIDFSNIVGVDIDVQRWNISTFARLYEASIFKDLDKIIHIDCDTIVTGSLSEYWNVDLKGKAVGGSLDCVSNWYKTDIGLSLNDPYLSCGNLVLNLDYIRKNNLEKKFTEYIKSKPNSLVFVDQEVLNACVCTDEKLVFTPKFNAFSLLYYFNYKEVKNLKRVHDFYDEKTVIESTNSPNIVHFTSCFMDSNRPWYETNDHPYRNEFLKYKSMSPWKTTPLFKDERGVISVFSHKMCHLLPGRLTILIFSFLYCFLKPITYKIKG